MSELAGQLTFLEQVEGETPQYEAFVKKFEAKKTTDDCYTPGPVYDAIADWVAREYGLDRAVFLRPFRPGGDYQAEEYPEGCAVVDNPPFSILAQIIKWYQAHGVKFFLFAPTLTLLTRRRDVCHIATGCDITYENGAEVKTSFVTNLEPGHCAVRSAPDLYQAVKAANAAELKEKRRELPKYIYPDCVLTAAMAYRFSQYGVPYRLDWEDCVRVSCLDDQKLRGKGSGIFGGGLLLSDSAAAEHASAERQAAERQAAERWRLSEREQRIVAGLGRKE